MDDYTKLSLQKKFMKHKLETDLDCYGEDYKHHEFCIICPSKDLCKKEWDLKKKERVFNANKELFTQEQKDWIKVYVSNAVADGIEDFFNCIEEEIDNLKGEE